MAWNGEMVQELSGKTKNGEWARQRVKERQKSAKGDKQEGKRQQETEREQNTHIKMSLFHGTKPTMGLSQL